MRGTRHVVGLVGGSPGIIPANAGNTVQNNEVLEPERDHPR